MSRCAACKARVDDGAVRCIGCGANLAMAASFIQVSGWVLIAISSMPLGLGVVSEGEHNHVPLAIGIGVLLLGLVLVLIGYQRVKAAEPTVILDSAPETGPDSAAKVG